MRGITPVIAIILLLLMTVPADMQGGFHPPRLTAHLLPPASAKGDAS